MAKLQWYFSIILLFLLTLFLSCSKNQPSKRNTSEKVTSSAGIVQENRSQVEAEILKISPLNNQNFEITLLIRNVNSKEGLGNFARVGDTISARPKFRIREGQIQQFNEGIPENKHLQSLIRMKPGERIKAELILGGGPEKRNWWILNWNKISDN